MEQEKGLLPWNFKYIGAIISSGFFLYALVHHFVEPNLFFDGLKNPNLFFCFGLILIITSKQTIEDEYANQIRLYAHSVISSFFIIFIFFNEIDGDKYSFLSELTGFLIIYLLIFFYSFKNGIEWIKKPSFKFQLLWLVIFIAILLSQRILWAS